MSLWACELRKAKVIQSFGGDLWLTQFHVTQQRQRSAPILIADQLIKRIRFCTSHSQSRRSSPVPISFFIISSIGINTYHQLSRIFPPLAFIRRCSWWAPSKLLRDSL